MKKIKLSVAALLIAGGGYCSGNDTANVNFVELNTQEIIVSCEDMIEWIRNDVHVHQTMDSVIGSLYIQRLLDIVSKAEDLNHNINTK